MPKVVSEKKFVSFIKGFVTEASPLAYPENASLDEDNFDLHMDGSRSRRQGIDYENSYSLTATGISETILKSSKQSFHKWDFPGGSTSKSIGVVRAYNKLWFINMLSSTPSASLLNGGSSISISGLANNEIQTAVISGLFVLVSEDLDRPVLLTYDEATDIVSQTTIPIQARDFWGVVDGLSVNERPSTLSESHEYNLKNQGWNDDISTTCGVKAYRYVRGRYYHLDDNGLWVPSPTLTTPSTSVFTAIRCTATDLGVYPSNADTWKLGEVVNSLTLTDIGKYSPERLNTYSIYNIEAPKGAYIIDAFNRGQTRRSLSGLNTLSLDKETGNLSTIASYAGRVFYAGITSKITDSDTNSPNTTGSIFFSQVITGEDKLGKCYQENDPTSEISDILDTDGGIISIPEISKIIKLVNIKDSLIVFAENGIWEVYGDTGGFKASNYQIGKISSSGISNPNTVVVTGTEITYWSKAGIFVLTPNQVTGRYSAQNISLSTIQSFYNSISDLAKRNTRGFYDEHEHHIRWLYNDESTYAEDAYLNRYNKILNLDLGLQAFYQYTISPLASNSPYVSDNVLIPNHVITSVSDDVFVNNDPIEANAIQVRVPISSSSIRTEPYSFLIFQGASFTIGQFKNNSFLDWETADGIGIDFSSYLVTGYEIYDDIIRNKQSPYVFFYLKRTEDGFTDTAGTLVSNNQSSCMVQAQWNWANSASGGKWGTPFQAYRYKRAYVPVDASDLFDTGDALITTKNKLRGRGKALSLKIYSETGKDLHLYGWATIVTGDGTP